MADYAESDDDFVKMDPIDEVVNELAEIVDYFSEKKTILENIISQYGIESLDKSNLKTILDMKDQQALKMLATELTQSYIRSSFGDCQDAEKVYALCSEIVKLQRNNDALKTNLGSVQQEMERLKLELLESNQKVINMEEEATKKIQSNMVSVDSSTYEQLTELMKDIKEKMEVMTLKAQSTVSDATPTAPEPSPTPTANLQQVETFEQQEVNATINSQFVPNVPPPNYSDFNVTFTNAPRTNRPPIVAERINNDGIRVYSAFPYNTDSDVQRQEYPVREDLSAERGELTTTNQQHPSPQFSVDDEILKCPICRSHFSNKVLMEQHFDDYCGK